MNSLPGHLGAVARLASSPGAMAKQGPVPGLGASSAITPILPTFKPIRAGFVSIIVPAGTSIATPLAGYIFRRVPIAQFQAEGSLVGAYMELLPTDSSPAGAVDLFDIEQAEAVGWGDTTGLTAAVAIAKSLNFAEQTWFALGDETSSAAVTAVDMPGMAAAGLVTSVGDGRRELPVLSTFPTGRFNDTTPNKLVRHWSFSPHQFKYEQQSTMDFVLLVRGDQIVNGGGTPLAICGYVNITAILGLIQDTTVFTDQRPSAHP